MIHTVIQKNESILCRFIYVFKYVVVLGLLHTQIHKHKYLCFMFYVYVYVSFGLAPIFHIIIIYLTTSFYLGTGLPTGLHTYNIKNEHRTYHDVYILHT